MSERDGEPPARSNGASPTRAKRVGEPPLRVVESDGTPPTRGRWLWFPLFPALCVAWFAYRLTIDVTPLRIAGLSINVLWLVLSIYDIVTRGRLRRWLYD